MLWGLEAAVSHALRLCVPSPYSCPLSLAAGNSGSAITQAIFFTSASMTEQEGFRWMGVMIIGVTLLVTTIHLPMWGGMFFKGE